MGDLSEIVRMEREAAAIEVPPSWRDHRFLGRAVLPAVETMRLLAAAALRWEPGIRADRISDARFDKFLEISPGSDRIEASIDLAALGDGGVRAALVTRVSSPAAKIGRSKEHGSLYFPKSPRPFPGLLPAPAAEAGGDAFSISPERLYRELVPFGPAYRNIRGPLILWPEGALARVEAPDLHTTDPEGPLGSPFPLDAAFHAACAWSQRYAGIVAFPVGIGDRIVLEPTCAGKPYAARVVPAFGRGAVLGFDIWISSPEGRVHEAALGVEMRDVSRGRSTPPEWIKA